MNKIIQKDVPKVPKGTHPKCQKGNLETAQKAVSYNKHIKQAPYTSSLRAYPPPGGGGSDPSDQSAFFQKKWDEVPDPRSGEVDEFGFPEFEPKLIGKAKTQFEMLEIEQKLAFKLIMNVPPIHLSDKRFNAVTALQIAKSKSLDEVRTAIHCYKDRLSRGRKPRSMGAALNSILKNGEIPITGQAIKYNK